MNPGGYVWLRGHGNQPVRDTHGEAVAFRITASKALAGHGTWYQLRTAHRAAQDIFGGWHTGLALIPIPLSELKEGPRQ
ncbi:hypothetical protein OG453_07010 [Streptomyces sp. NBC_01381]|uniref:hypothetical protein n=1 Tax=Streptomyces sp. NBC_01381 TaxID=2903845 RepID=UPI002253263E|nr:hypothetical protein [Streptomyces sp. NBC_01381]MCX4666417.1 hypothetical protein [Streptomyces sp. NBC_01381]